MTIEIHHYRATGGTMMKLAVTLAAALLTACGSALPASLAAPQDPVAAVLARLADTHGVAGDRP